MIERQIYVGQRLRLNSLRSVNHQQCPITGSQTARYLIGKVDMTRGVNQIQHISFAILRHIVQANCLRLDRDAAFAFQLHLVEQLVLHLAGGNGAGNFDQAISQGRFAMVNMGDNRKVADVGSVQVAAPSPFTSFNI